MDVDDIFRRAKQWKKYTIANNFSGEHVSGAELRKALEEAGENGELSTGTAYAGNPYAAASSADAEYRTELEAEGFRPMVLRDEVAADVG